MDLIPSFAVDHTQIIPGIFESRVDVMGDECVTTFDVRLKRPNREPVGKLRRTIWSTAEMET